MISLVVEHQSSQGEGPVTQSQCLVVFFFYFIAEPKLINKPTDTNTNK